MAESVQAVDRTKRATAWCLPWPTMLVAVVCVIYVSGLLISTGGDPTMFAVLGTRFSAGDPHGSEGYDGQFAYQIARSPLAAAPFLDVPAYRYQRLLYPILAHLLAFGRPDVVPWVLIALNVAAITVGTWAAGCLLAECGVSPWYALACGLYGGQLLALRTDLNEPLAYALVACAMLAWTRQRVLLAGICFALAALAKETTLIFLAAYVLHHLSGQAWRRVGMLALAGLPFAGLQALLWVWLGTPGIGSGGANATPFSLVPLGAWLSIAQVKPAAFLLVALVVVPMSVLPALAGIGLSVRDLVRGLNHPIVLSLLLNALVILFLPASTLREPAAMVRLTQGLALAMLLYGGLRRSRRILSYSTLWILTNVLLVKGVAG
jgi:hypothetical protein